MNIFPSQKKKKKKSVASADWLLAAVAAALPASRVAALRTLRAAGQ